MKKVEVYCDDSSEELSQIKNDVVALSAKREKLEKWNQKEYKEIACNLKIIGRKRVKDLFDVLFKDVNTDFEVDRYLVNFVIDSFIESCSEIKKELLNKEQKDESGTN